MRLHSRLCAVSNALITHFKPSSFVTVQKYNLGDFTIYKTVRNILQTKKQMSVTDWRKLSQICSSRAFGYQAYAGLLSLDPGLPELKKLFSALEEEEMYSMVLKAQTLQVFNIYKSDCSEEDYKFIQDTIDEISNKFPVLTPQILKPILYGAAVIPKWKETCEHLGSKLTTVDSCVYEVSALAAFHHNDFSYAWEQLRKASSIAYVDNWCTEVFHEIVQSHKRHPNEGLLSKLFDFMEEFSLMLPLSVAEEIDNILNEDINRVSRISSMSLSGHCECCKEKLRKIPLTDEERNTLLKSVEKRFEADCKFATYEKKELSDFKMFLKMAPPYSAVVDGANLFFRTKSQGFAQARKTLNNLEAKGHKVLLISRNHTSKIKPFISIFNNHLTYFVKDRSVDDAYVMYAAISSGLDTVVVSNDFYGTFFAHMPPESRLIYKKWQLSNHVVGTGYLGTHLVFPAISPICQRSEASPTFHIPIVPDTNTRNAFSATHWLCIQHVTEEQKAKADALWPKRKFEMEPSDSQYAFKGHVLNVKEKGKLLGARKNKHYVRN